MRPTDTTVQAAGMGSLPLWFSIGGRGSLPRSLPPLGFNPLEKAHGQTEQPQCQIEGESVHAGERKTTDLRRRSYEEFANELRKRLAPGQVQVPFASALIAQGR